MITIIILKVFCSQSNEMSFQQNRIIISDDEKITNKFLFNDDDLIYENYFYKRKP